LSRYDTQARFAQFGPDGQAALERARVAIVGVGALGSAAAEGLARAGVGALRLVDRDLVELSNLHRQSLYDEDDWKQARPKAVAAATHLERLRSDLPVEALVADLDGANALELLSGCDLVLDGSDNFEARQVLNEACLESATPWVHAACLGSRAVAWAIVPGRACFACLVPEVPPPGEAGTCDAAGVLPPAVQAAVAQQLSEAFKIFAGRDEELLPGPWNLDVWTGRASVVAADADPDCRACGRRDWAFLGRARSGEVIACGRNGVQLAPAGEGPVDLETIASRLGEVEGLTRNRFLLRFAAGAEELTLFRDGRVLVSGTRDPARARAVAARWLGG
jgi:adenylyltransferase/sulfurtransferase